MAYLTIMANIGKRHMRREVFSTNLNPGSGMLNFQLDPGDAFDKEDGLQWSIIFESFTSSEAAKITDVSPATQRDWRRRGMLPKKQGDGWTRYSPIDLAALIILRHLTAHGITVSKASQIVDASFLRILGLFLARKGSTASESDIRMTVTENDVPDRYLVTSPQSTMHTHDKNAEDTYGFADLKTMMSFLKEDDSPAVATVIDLKKIVDLVCCNAPLPLMVISRNMPDEEINS